MTCVFRFDIISALQLLNPAAHLVPITDEAEAPFESSRKQLLCQPVYLIRSQSKLLVAKILKLNIYASESLWVHIWLLILALNWWFLYQLCVVTVKVQKWMMKSCCLNWTFCFLSFFVLHGHKRKVDPQQLQSLVYQHSGCNCLRLLVLNKLLKCGLKSYK